MDKLISDKLHSFVTRKEALERRRHFWGKGEEISLNPCINISNQSYHPPRADPLGGMLELYHEAWACLRFKVEHQCKKAMAYFLFAGPRPDLF